MVIKKPDDTLYTGNSITINDINEFRDVRGTTRGNGHLVLRVKANSVSTEAPVSRVFIGKKHMHISVVETITSKSAPPLVNDPSISSTGRIYQFDLFSIGNFTATASISHLPANLKMQLIDPDGVVVRTSNNGRLLYPVTLRTLGRSRDANGNPRLWSLRVFPLPENLLSQQVKVSASVIQTVRFNTSIPLERIKRLFGVGLSLLSIYGEMKAKDLLVRLVIRDEIAAETIDMHNLLDGVIIGEGLADTPIQPGKYLDIKAGQIYTLYRMSRKFKGILEISNFELRVRAINISIGVSKKIKPPIPSIALEVLPRSKRSYHPQRFRYS